MVTLREPQGGVGHPSTLRLTQGKKPQGGVGHWGIESGSHRGNADWVDVADLIGKTRLDSVKIRFISLICVLCASHVGLQLLQQMAQPFDILWDFYNFTITRYKIA